MQRHGWEDVCGMGHWVLVLPKEPFKLTKLPSPLAVVFLARHPLSFHQMHKPKVIAIEKPEDHASLLSQSSDLSMVSHLLSDLLPCPLQTAQQHHGYHCLEAILLWSP